MMNSFKQDLPEFVWKDDSNDGESSTHIEFKYHWFLYLLYYMYKNVLLIIIVYGLTEKVRRYVIFHSL